MAAKRSTKRSTTKKTAARGAKAKAKKPAAKKAKAAKASARKPAAKAAKAAPKKAAAPKRPAAPAKAKAPAAPKAAAAPKPPPPAAPAPAALKPRFVWVELMSTDLGAAQGFYTSLMGWGTKTVDVAPPMNKYTMFNWNNEEFGGLAPKPEPNAPNTWLAYVAVSDVDKTTSRVAELGGKVLMGPMDIPGVGRFSVIADPTGGVVAPMTFTEAPRPQQKQGLFGPVAWVELQTDDSAKALAFYKELFGWGAAEMPAGDMGTYYILKTGDRDAGGLGGRMPGLPANTWVVYFAVDDVDAKAAAAAAAGAKVLAPAIDIPNVGRMTWATDPQGALFALFKGSPQ